MREIILSKRAATRLEKLLTFLETKWSVKTKDYFIAKLDRSLDHIKEFPESNEKSDIKKGLYRCVITKQTTIFYQFEASRIYVVTLFDTRMNPNRISREIN